MSKTADSNHHLHRTARSRASVTPILRIPEPELHWSRLDWADSLRSQFYRGVAYIFPEVHPLAQADRFALSPTASKAVMLLLHQAYKLELPPVPAAPFGKKKRRKTT